MTSNTIDRGVVNKFNRGEVAPEAFAREDVERLQNSCALMENFQPQRLGPMRYRAGTEMVGFQTTDDNSIMVPFNTDLDDPIMLVFGEGGGTPHLRFMRSDALLARTVTTSAMLNQEFDSAMGVGWTDADEGSAASTITGGDQLQQIGTGPDAAKVWQTLGTLDTGTPHGFIINVDRGSVLFQIGENGVDSADLFEEKFEKGIHVIEVTPAASLTITISNDSKIPSLVTYVQLASTTNVVSVSLEDALGVNILTSQGITGLRTLRWAPSANIQYFCGERYIPFEVKRWGDTSFSVQRYVNSFGPYENLNISSITMNPDSVIDGDMEVVTNRRYFDNVYDSDKGFDKGTLLKMAVTGQTQTVTGSAKDVATDGIFVFGVGDARKFWVLITTTGAYGEVVLEKSFDEITWQTVVSYITGLDIGVTYNDGLDGSEIYYRLRVEAVGAMTTIDLELIYDYGTLEAQGRIREVTGASGDTVQVQWYVDLNEDQTVKDWYIGSWGGRNPFPTSLALYEGRLWFAGNNKVWGSESDFYESHDRTLAGDSSAIQRTIGFGSSKDVVWLAPSARLVLGTELNEIDVRSTSFGEVLTDQNTNLKSGSTRGCANVRPIVMDQEIIFVQRSGRQLLSMNFDVKSERHSIEDFNMLHPSIFGTAKAVAMDYTTTPEMRIYVVLDDGTVRVLLRDQTEGILAWYRLKLLFNDLGTEEVVKDVAVLPGTDRDHVYFTVSETSTKGSILKLAGDDEADGTSASKHLDRWTSYTSPGTTITLDFAYTGDVAVWADGADRGDFTVAAGQITVGSAWTDVIVGYRYTAKYKSPKLGDYTAASVLAGNKRVIDTALLMKDYTQGAVQVGPDESSLSDMPLIEKGKAAADDSEYDELPFEFDGESETDPRIHIHATGPCNIQALVYEMKDTDRRTRKAQQ